MGCRLPEVWLVIEDREAEGMSDSTMDAALAEWEEDKARIRALEDQAKKQMARAEKAEASVNERDVQMSRLLLRLSEAEAELLKDRNEGECYGPFHAGFVCRACADRIRALQAEIARLSIVNGDAWRQRAEKAEAALAAFVDYFDTWDVSPPQLTRLLNELRAAGRDSGRPKG
jgi:chromosome segregation ATPase